MLIDKKITQQLKAFTSSTAGVYGTLVHTVDGREIAFDLQNDDHASRLSAMLSSLQALGESVAEFSGQQQCRFVIIENVDGYLVTLRISDILMLSILARNEANLGLLLSASKKMAAALGSSVE